MERRPGIRIRPFLVHLETEVWLMGLAELRLHSGVRKRDTRALNAFGDPSLLFPLCCYCFAAHKASIRSSAWKILHPGLAFEGEAAVCRE